MKICGHRGAKDERPENTLTGIQFAIDCGAKDFSLNIATIDKKLVNECQVAGLFIGVWTVNDSTQLKYFKNPGVDYLATDKPSIILKNIS